MFATHIHYVIGKVGSRRCERSALSTSRRDPGCVHRDVERARDCRRHCESLPSKHS